MINSDALKIKFTSKEIRVWGGLSLLKKIMDGMGLQDAIRHWNFPTPGSNEAALSVVILAYNLTSVFRQAVIRQISYQTLSTLRHKVLAMGENWEGYQKSLIHLKGQLLI